MKGESRTGGEGGQGLGGDGEGRSVARVPGARSGTVTEREDEPGQGDLASSGGYSKTGNIEAAKGDNEDFLIHESALLVDGEWRELRMMNSLTTNELGAHEEFSAGEDIPRGRVGLTEESEVEGDCG